MMSQFATIFLKIKDTFFNDIDRPEKENHQVLFAPFSIGYSEDDFLFLDTSTASDEATATKYSDELFEFSQIANTIPRSADFWEWSDDLVYKYFRQTLQNLRLLDTGSLTIDFIYDTALFTKAMETLDGEEVQSYRQFYDLFWNEKKAIDELKDSLTPDNEEIVQFQLKQKSQNIQKIKEKWKSSGNKKMVEQQIIELIKQEFHRFLHLLEQTKGKLESTVRTHLGSGVDYNLTFCQPNNLYHADELDWRKIVLDKEEIKKIARDKDSQSLSEIFDDNEFENLDIKKISFELMFVNILRAWFEEELLQSPFWNIRLLNEDEIMIPQYTTHFVFIRQVHIEFMESSGKKTLISNANKEINVGPFILKNTQRTKGNTMELGSVNTSLNIKRKSVLNVTSHLADKVREDGAGPGKLIRTKQKQFIKLAPGMQKSSNQNKIFNPSLLKTTIGKARTKVRDHRHRTKKRPPVRDHRSQTNNRNHHTVKAVRGKSMMQLTFAFKDDQTNKVIPVHVNDIRIFDQKSKRSVKIKSSPHHQFTAWLNKRKSYRIQLKTSGYERENFPLNFTSREKALRHLIRKFQLSKIKTTPLQETKLEDHFQLIGVVTKKLGPYPNPIKGADYV